MKLRIVASLIACCVCGSFATAAEPQAAEKKPLHKFLPIKDKSNVSLAYIWLDIAEEATAQDVDAHGARPTIISRTLAIWATAMYDAWAAYDERAVGSRLGGKLRRPSDEHTLENKKTAISYASYHALVFVYPESKEYLAGDLTRLGYDPNLVSNDPAKPEGVGYLAAQAVIDYRSHDGANQLGDEAGGDGTPYADYTYYKPVNSPNKILNPGRWQPIPFARSDGTQFIVGFLTPHWYRVKPFALERSDQFRPEPPPTTVHNNEQLKKEVDEVLAYNASLTNEQKAIVEFMRSIPGEMVTLDLPTWSATAEMAALSRCMGGYHIATDNNVGLRVGREIAVWSWPKYQAYFDGTAKVRD
jgi:hypothetical protein